MRSRARRHKSQLTGLTHGPFLSALPHREERFPCPSGRKAKKSGHESAARLTKRPPAPRKAANERPRDDSRMSFSPTKVCRAGDFWLLNERQGHLRHSRCCVLHSARQGDAILGVAADRGALVRYARTACVVVSTCRNESVSRHREHSGGALEAGGHASRRSTAARYAAAGCEVPSDAFQRNRCQPARRHRVHSVVRFRSIRNLYGSSRMSALPAGRVSRALSGAGSRASST